MKMIDELSEVTFWAVNTKEAEKLIGENKDKITDGMTDTEKKAYKLGVDNAFSLLNQLLQQGINNESIQFYNPDVECGEEFSEEELMNWLATKWCK